MSKGIRLSKKHGLNPSMAVCFFCNEDNGEIIIPGKLPGDAEAPRRAVWDKSPCDKCKALMSRGIICISTKDGEKDRENPYRTGGWCVVTAEAFERIFTAIYKPAEKAKEFVASVLKARVCFLEDAVWDKVGLPRGAVEGVPSELPKQA